MAVSFRHAPTETLARREMEEEQLVHLRETVAWALKTPFYAARLADCGISSPSDIRALADLSRVPLTTKDDLRDAYPDQLLAVPRRDVVRIHTSSGTTGTPTVIYHTASDLDSWTELTARSLVATGVSPEDVFQNMMTYGLFTGGLGLHYAAERLGALVIPVSSGNTKRQLKLMQDFETTVVHATPSYMLHIRAKMDEEGIPPESLHLRRAVLGAEPYSENTRRKIESLFGLDAYNSYGLSEMNGPGVAFECVYKDGMHLWEDAYVLEVIDPDSGEPVPEGEEGELVLTTLRRHATPLLRYRTKDLTFVYPEPCPCGRTHRRIGRIKARTDDMLIINGVNVFPSQIEEAIMKVPGVGTNYQIHIDKDGSLDRVVVNVEVTAEAFTDDRRSLEALQRRIQEELRASIIIKPSIALHEPGQLPVSEGKAVRVVDERPAL